MRVLLDGKMIGSSATLGEALVLAARKAGHRLVVDAKADGHRVPQRDLDQPPVEEGYAEELSITSAEPADLVTQALHDAADALGGLHAEQSTVAELLQVGETKEAMERLSKLVGVWQQVDETVRLAGQALGEAMPRERLDEAAGELTTHLCAVRDGLQRGDLTSVADLLAYEMDGLPERWSMLLREVAGQLEALCAAQAG